MSKFSVATDYEYNKNHKRDCVTVWSGAFCSVWEATGLSLPSGGYMLRTFSGKKIRVTCPSPRTDENYLQVDAAISAAMEKI
jgi:hypothetical protein